MRFKDVFSIIGPSMIGPSSSHTAGAVRLGRVARHLLGSVPEEVEIIFYGSFAQTYRGHGTDLAIVAGLLNYHTDDVRIPDALEHAARAGMKVAFQTSNVVAAHPNTAKITMRHNGRVEEMIGYSIGGGNIEIVNVNQFDIKFTATYPTLLIFHADRFGIVAEMTTIFQDRKTNIGFMEVDRKSRSGDALTVIESDHSISPTIVHLIEQLSDVQRVCMIEMDDEEVVR